MQKLDDKVNSIAKTRRRSELDCKYSIAMQKLNAIIEKDRFLSRVNLHSELAHLPIMLFGRGKQAQMLMVRLIALIIFT